MFSSGHQVSPHSSFPHASREDNFQAILKKIQEKKQLSMQEVRIYESMSRNSRLLSPPADSRKKPYTVLAHQDGVSYIEKVFAHNTVDAMHLVLQDPKFEDELSLKACYPGHFQHEFSFDPEDHNGGI